MVGKVSQTVRCSITIVGVKLIVGWTTFSGALLGAVDLLHSQPGLVFHLLPKKRVSLRDLGEHKRRTVSLHVQLARRMSLPKELLKRLLRS